jgi:uncharacterized glyoxalase superfamily protein PhnB
MITTTTTPPTVYPTLRYRDAQAAIDFLVSALGFEAVQVVRGPNGAIGHAELTLGNGMVMVADGSPEGETSIFDTGTTSIYVVLDDPDAHHDRAVAAGAEIAMALRDTDYGSRDYTARDPEGNVWTFGTYQPMSPAEAS